MLPGLREYTPLVEQLLASLQSSILDYETKHRALSLLVNFIHHSPNDSASIVDRGGVLILSKFLNDSNEKTRERLFKAITKLIADYGKGNFSLKFNDAFYQWEKLAQNDFSDVSEQYPLRLILFLAQCDEEKKTHLVNKIIPQITTVPQLLLLAKCPLEEVAIGLLQRIVILTHQKDWRNQIHQQEGIESCLHAEAGNINHEYARFLILSGLSLEYAEILIEKQILNYLENYILDLALTSLMKKDAEAIIRMLLNLANRYGFHDDTKTLDPVKKYFNNAHEIKQILEDSHKECFEKFREVIEASKTPEESVSILIRKNAQLLDFLKLDTLFLPTGKEAALTLAEILQTAKFNISRVNSQIKEVLPDFPGVDNLLNHGLQVAPLGHIEKQNQREHGKYISEETESIFKRIREKVEVLSKKVQNALYNVRYSPTLYKITPTPPISLREQVAILNLMALGQGRKFSMNAIFNELNLLNSLIKTHAERTDNYICCSLPSFTGVESVLSKLLNSTHYNEKITGLATSMMKSYKEYQRTDVLTPFPIKP